MQTELLPGLPLTFHVGAMIFREGVTGVKGDTRPSSGVMWNGPEWDIR